MYVWQLSSFTCNVKRLERHFALYLDLSCHLAALLGIILHAISLPRPNRQRGLHFLVVNSRFHAAIERQCVPYVQSHTPPLCTICVPACLGNLGEINATPIEMRGPLPW